MKEFSVKLATGAIPPCCNSIIYLKPWSKGDTCHSGGVIEIDGKNYCRRHAAKFLLDAHLGQGFSFPVYAELVRPVVLISEGHKEKLREELEKIVEDAKNEKDEP